MNRRSASVASSKKTKRTATRSSNVKSTRLTQTSSIHTLSATSRPSSMVNVQHSRKNVALKGSSQTTVYNVDTSSSNVQQRRTFSSSFRSTKPTLAKGPDDLYRTLTDSLGTQDDKIKRIRQERAIAELLRNNPTDDDPFASSSSTEWTTDVEGDAHDFDHRLARVTATQRKKRTVEDVRELENNRVKHGPTPVQYDQAQGVIDTLEQRLTIDDQPDEAFPFLDPLNPPNLTYEHVKLLKNIDYSPLIRRAKQGGMFTVEDVITLLQNDGISNKFKAGMRREHLQDPFVFEQTFDLFNKGKKPCPLCLPDPTPNKENRIHYTNVNLLRKYISTTGLILPRRVSGVCAKHQNKLRFAIKNAKQLALLSFTNNWHVPLSYVYPDKYPSYEDQDAAANVERIRRYEIRELYENLREDKLDMIHKNRMLNKSLPESAELGDLVVDSTGGDGALEPDQKSVEQLIADRITDDMNESEVERIRDEEYRRDELRRDMGDLVDLNKFDPDMSFDQFVARYNAMIASKDPQTLSHRELLIEDSSDSDNPLVDLYRPLDTNRRTQARRAAEEAYRRTKDDDE